MSLLLAATRRITGGGGLCPRGESHCPERDPRAPSVDRMTDASKNITLFQTSFAGGNNVKSSVRTSTLLQRTISFAFIHSL